MFDRQGRSSKGGSQRVCPGGSKRANEASLGLCQHINETSEDLGAVVAETAGADDDAKDEERSAGGDEGEDKTEDKEAGKGAQEEGDTEA